MQFLKLDNQGKTFGRLSLQDGVAFLTRYLGRFTSEEPAWVGEAGMFVSLEDPDPIAVWVEGGKLLTRQYTSLLDPFQYRDIPLVELWREGFVIPFVVRKDGVPVFGSEYVMDWQTPYISYESGKAALYALLPMQSPAAVPVPSVIAEPKSRDRTKGTTMGGVLDHFLNQESSYRITFAALQELFNFERIQLHNLIKGLLAKRLMESELKGRDLELYLPSWISERLGLAGFVDDLLGGDLNRKTLLPNSRAHKYLDQHIKRLRENYAA
jgi:hypothetical protein